MDMKNAGTLQFVGIQTLNARRRDECLHFALECLDQLCLPVRIQFRKHIIQKPGYSPISSCISSISASFKDSAVVRR